MTQQLVRGQEQQEPEGLCSDHVFSRRFQLPLVVRAKVGHSPRVSALGAAGHCQKLQSSFTHGNHFGQIIYSPGLTVSFLGPTETPIQQTS